MRTCCAWTLRLSSHSCGRYFKTRSAVSKIWHGSCSVTIAWLLVGLVQHACQTASRRRWLHLPQDTRDRSLHTNCPIQCLTCGSTSGHLVKTASQPCGKSMDNAHFGMRNSDKHTADGVSQSLASLLGISNVTRNQHTRTRPSASACQSCAARDVEYAALLRGRAALLGGGQAALATVFNSHALLRFYQSRQ